MERNERDMNYIGSKLSLLSFLDESINKVIDKSVCHTFCDLFAGTGIVGSYFKQKGFSIISNDLQYYSYVLNKHYIGNHKYFNFTGLFDEIPELKQSQPQERHLIVCDFLSNLCGQEGFIYKNYSAAGSKDSQFERMYFSDENAKKCDAIRSRIEDWHNNQKINDNEYYFLIASLLEVIDKHANTASVYGAFLKKLKTSAQKTLELVPARLIINEQDHVVYNSDANKLIKTIHPDILYLDPPYNERQYASNYHLLETIAKYDNPQIKGKTGLRDYSNQKSEYCSKSSVKKAFSDLIQNADCKYIFLSYNNEGLLGLDDIKEIMSKKGKYGFFTQKYNRFKADSNRDYAANSTTEYLHWCIVGE